MHETTPSLTLREPHLRALTRAIQTPVLGDVVKRTCFKHLGVDVLLDVDLRHVQHAAPQALPTHPRPEEE